MKFWLHWLAGISLLIAVLATFAASQCHHPTARQTQLLAELLQLQDQRAAIVNAREPLLPALTGPARSAVADHQWPSAAPLAAAAADELHQEQADVQTSEDRWLTAQAEFATLSAQRDHTALLLSLAACLLATVSLIAALAAKRRHTLLTPNS